jgi:VWFA-related protein
MTLRRFSTDALAVLAAWLLFSAPNARTQETQGPIAPKPGATVQNVPEGTIRVKVAMVNAPVAVTDAKGELVLDLDKTDFQVLDNGVVQTIESFDLGGEPLSAVLVFETSSRIAPLLPAVQKSAIIFTQSVIGPSGEAAVLGYSDTVDNLLPFTGDHDQIEKTIANLKPGTSGTRLYNALSAAVNMLRDRPVTRRRVIIAVGESRDTGSEDRLGAVLREAQLSNVVIYSVGVSEMSAEFRSPPRETTQATPPGTFGMPPVPGTAQTPTSEQQQRGGNIDLMPLAEWTVQHATAIVKERSLELAATATGGLHQSALRDRTIDKAVDQIGGELNAQYTLSYRPIGTAAAGYHKIRIVVDRAGAKVRTRPGYYLQQ